MLIDTKRRQGFQVETKTTQAIAATVSGRDLSEKIRNWLKGRWEAHRPDPVYTLLVGNGDIIPTARSRPRSSFPVGSDDPLYPIPAPNSDWYYADLDSEWNRTATMPSASICGVGPTRCWMKYPVFGPESSARRWTARCRRRTVWYKPRHGGRLVG